LMLKIYTKVQRLINIQCLPLAGFHQALQKFKIFPKKDQGMSRKITRNLTEKNKVFQREIQDHFRKYLVLF
uniref:hypothetical protein n=1 Tax=uncultured Bacteroides sp. TaxID=162156 RepID=UPI00280ACB1F